MIHYGSWFQLGAIPDNAVGGHYDLLLVALSYAIAVLASYVALNLVGRLRSEHNAYAKLYWLAGGAFTMGAGIWSMHFIGMLAFIMPMPMAYELGWTLSSLLMAVLASGLALFILQKDNYTKAQLAYGGIIIGLAIATMHYMGMEGMKNQMQIHYLPGLFFLSIGVGIAAAEAALYLSLESNKGSNKRQSNLKFISAFVMGIAICGMHYTGMMAAVFTPKHDHVMGLATQGIPPNDLAFFIAGITALIISLALTASNSYKKMITAVENEKNFLKALLDNLKDDIIACDGKGQITVINQSLQNKIGALQEHLHMDDLLEYFKLSTTNNNTPLSKNEWPLNQTLKGFEVHDVNLLMAVKNEAPRDVVIDGQKIVDTEGRNIGAVAVIRDVTELKRTEKLKSEFVSIVSHELRTPLTSIRGSLGLLVSGIMGEFPEKANKLLAIANNNCERLLLLINDILDIEKIEAGKMDFQLKTQNLETIVAECVVANTMYAEKFGVDLEFKPENTSTNVHVDSARLMQVLNNLISNACKFSPKNEKIVVSIKLDESVVRVGVSDRGPGIPTEFQSRIFQKFSQADSSDTRGKGGTGLGLNISKAIMQKLSGSIGFFNNTDQGTTFYIDLPIYLDINALTAETKGIKGRLLVCEDDKDQSDYLKMLLESAGFIVDVADTVAKTKHLLTQFVYEALLLDLILPDQDGIAFIRELRSQDRSKTLHIIVVSVIAQTGQAILSDDGMDGIDWIDKPIDFSKLLTSINRVKTS